MSFVIRLEEEETGSEKSIVLPQEIITLLPVDILKCLSTKFGGRKGKRDELIGYLMENKLSIEDLIKPELETVCWYLNLSEWVKNQNLSVDYQTISDLKHKVC